MAKIIEVAVSASGAIQNLTETFQLAQAVQQDRERNYNMAIQGPNGPMDPAGMTAGDMAAMPPAAMGGMLDSLSAVWIFFLDSISTPNLT